MQKGILFAMAALLGAAMAAPATAASGKKVTLTGEIIDPFGGRADIGAEKMFDMDLAYAASRTILLDIALILMTERCWECGTSWASAPPSWLRPACRWPSSFTGRLLWWPISSSSTSRNYSCSSIGTGFRRSCGDVHLVRWKLAHQIPSRARSKTPESFRAGKYSSDPASRQR